MEEFISAMLQGPFAVCVAAYLLVRMESRLDELTSAIVRLGASIDSALADCANSGRERGKDVSTYKCATE
jgi:hypothetical protein